LFLPPFTAHAFTIDEVFYVCNPGGFDCPAGPGLGQSLDVLTTLEEAPRWSATLVSGAGLHDGIQVAVPSGFGEAIAPGMGTLVDQALLDAFSAWSSPAVSYDVTFGTTGFELDVFAVFDSHPVFTGNDFSGFGSFVSEFSNTRTLTNGVVLPGWAITSANIYFNIDRLQAAVVQLCLLDFNPLCSPAELDLAVDGFTNLAIHEIGHTLGLNHPNEFPFANFDTDNDPTNVIAVDPNDPLAGLTVSANIDPNAVMVNNKSLTDPSLFFTSLQGDDLSGREVLYPVAVPEPAGLALGALALSVAEVARRRRSDR